MIESVQVSFAGVPKSEALETLITKEAEKLERFFDRIVSCRVRVHQPYKRQGMPYGVHIEIGVPGDTIVVDEEPTASTLQAHRDAQRAIRDAFHTAARRLEEYARRLRTPRV
jgi:ribosome-associated translation inhibitor RaiA